MPTFLVTFFQLFTRKVLHSLHQPLGPVLHLPIPIAIHHLICSLVPIVGLHGFNVFRETSVPWLPQIEHHIDSNPLYLLRKGVKVTVDLIAAFQSNADILHVEFFYSSFSYLSPYWLPILWVTGQNEVANAYSWLLLRIKVDVSPVFFISFQLSSQCLIIDSDTL